ncbi:MAG: hypothetical protein KME46_13995 [Brasilonema angustatum HA4187-MV1]|nr:hypothetical protein [Brasilonema angustatum HA4187-MV1]
MNTRLRRVLRFMADASRCLTLLNQNMNQAIAQTDLIVTRYDDTLMNVSSDCFVTDKIKISRL